MQPSPIGLTCDCATQLQEYLMSYWQSLCRKTTKEETKFQSLLYIINNALTIQICSSCQKPITDMKRSSHIDNGPAILWEALQITPLFSCSKPCCNQVYTLKKGFLISSLLCYNSTQYCSPRNASLPKPKQSC